MSRYNRPEFDIVHTLQRRVDDLERRVKQLENSRTVALPTYGKTGLTGFDLVAGQIFIGKDQSLNYVVGTSDNYDIFEVKGTLFSTL